MSNYKIQDVFGFSYDKYCGGNHFQSDIQRKVARAIIACKSGALGCNISRCDDCGHTEIHNNSCRNRNCPSCQAVLKEVWIDKRKSEVMDSPYFHVVFTLPHELNSLIYCNQKLLYGLLHKCTVETLLELSANKEYLGATPGIIQVLHTWNQELLYHVHMHCIVSGGGLTVDGKIRKTKKKFFIPVYKLRDKFKGKYLALLDSYHKSGMLVFSKACSNLRNSYEWKELKYKLYNIDWCPYIKETFNGFGNAIEYLGRYAHKIAISNNRILSVNESETVFSARGKLPGESQRIILLNNEEFIRRFLLHVLPSGFQKIRYYGFLNNRTKKKKLELIFKLQGYQKFKSRFTGMTVAELMEAIWRINIHICKVCGCMHMNSIGRTHVPVP